MSVTWVRTGRVDPEGYRQAALAAGAMHGSELLPQGPTPIAIELYLRAVYVRSSKATADCAHGFVRGER